MTAADGSAVRAQGLTKRYGSILALDGLDLDVPAGSIFGLLGPNGAGKTTTIRIFTGLAQMTSGSAAVAGVPVGLDRPDLRRRIGYLDQDPRFYAWMRGRELLELAGRLAGLDGRGLRDRVAAMLETTGLRAAGERRIGGWSGGMRQRLGIAQALIHEPAVVFLDEPVSSLDPEGRRDLLELIAALRGRTTVVLSTHVLADVERVCDRVAILDRGRLVTEGPLDELLAQHARPVLRLLPEPHQEAAVERLHGALAAAPWVVAVRDDVGGMIHVDVRDAALASEAILPLVVASGVRLASFERARPTLEEVFLELVGPPSPDDLDGRGFVRAREVER
ncbi:MAG TPA: ABC transporter ATP-binding protein [Candidatus Limnocylindrales bacterium]|nr:ABC transporter ATP-binding protein [Candidatus Limnocylindrales bacterium]